MKQKLIAVAVAGALAAPAAALAQSTVQIYGTLKAEYGFVSAPDHANPALSYKNWDGFNSGASNIGFKGEEKLGGGLSAFFQCESDLRFMQGGTRTSGSLCDRNSALGLKGGFGSFFVGTWDSPEKLAIGRTRMLEDTGWTGVTHMLFQESNRNAHSINYHSPNFGGFSMALQTTSTNAASAATADGFKGRSNGLNLLYGQGPLDVAFGYTEQDDNRSSSGGTSGKDTSMTLGGAYKFGPAKVGVTYNKWKAEGAAGEVKRDAWNFAVNYDFTGANYLWAGYTLAKDFKGSLGGADTGGDEWQVGVGHKLSKRTEARIGYARVKNDSNGDNYVVGGSGYSAANMRNGSKSSVVALQMFHRF